jgi:hypothetical protein
VDDAPLKVNEKHGAVLRETWSEQRVPGTGALGIARAQPDAPTLEGVLFDRQRAATALGGIS